MTIDLDECDRFLAGLSALPWAKQQVAEIFRLARLGQRYEKLETCVVCQSDIVLLDRHAPPHCEYCYPTDDQRIDWEEWVCAQEKNDDH